MKAHRALYAALAILLLAGGLRVVGLDRTGIEIDEAFSVQLAALSPAGIVRGTAADLHPPLYYLLLHVWMQVAGNSAFAARFLSALLGWLTVALVYRLGRQLSPVLGLLAAALLGLSPPHLWYSQQARQYALLVLLLVASTWFAWRWWSGTAGKRTPISLLYLATTLAAVYTHTFAFFVLAAQTAAALFLSGRSIGEEWRRLVPRWLALQFAVLAGFAPWLPVMVDQALHRGAPWVPPFSWPVLRSSWLFLLQGRDWSGSVLDYASALLGLVILFLALWPPLHARWRDGRLLGWTALWLAVPILLVTVVALFFKPIYQNKQLLVVVPALMLLLAAGCLRPAPRFVRALLVVALLGCMAYARYQQYVDPYRQSWDEVAAYLDARAQPGDLLYMNTAAAELAVDYYLVSDLDAAGYPAGFQFERGGWYGDIATAGAVEAQLGPLAMQHGRVWLLEYFPDFWDPQGLILQWLRAHYASVNRVQIGELSLWLFTR